MHSQFCIFVCIYLSITHKQYKILYLYHYIKYVYMCIYKCACLLVFVCVYLRVYVLVYKIYHRFHKYIMNHKHIVLNIMYMHIIRYMPTRCEFLITLIQENSC